MKIFNPNPQPLKRGDRVIDENKRQGIIVSPKGLSGDEPSIKQFELVKWETKDDPVWVQTVHMKKKKWYMR